MIVIPQVKDLPQALKLHAADVQERIANAVPSLSKAKWPVLLTEYYDGTWKTPAGNTPVVVQSLPELAKIISEGLSVFSHGGWALYFKDDTGANRPCLYASDFIGVRPLSAYGV